MEKDVEDTFNKILELTTLNALEIGKVYSFIEQHSNVINGNKDKTQISIEEIELKLKSFQTDLDKTIDMIHQLKTLPNILEALKKVEKSKTDRSI